MHVGIEATLKGIRLGVLVLDDLRAPSGPETAARWEKAREGVLERFTVEILSHDERLQAARRMMWDNGVDPAASPPSCERLIRRVLEGESFPDVHPFIQRGWIAGMDIVLPVSVFDLGLLPETVTLRKGKGGEGYLGVLGERVLTEHSVTFYDKYFRPFGGPEGDSVDVAPREGTRALLVVFYAAPMYSEAALQAYLSRVEGLFLNTFGGRRLERRVTG